MSLGNKPAFAFAAGLLLLNGSAAMAQSVNIDSTVARVVYVPQDRADFEITVTNERGVLPPLRVTRRGQDVTIANSGNHRLLRLSSCNVHRSTAAPTSPGAGARVNVRNIGQVNLEDAPHILISGPRDVDIRASGAVFGSIGRGARSVDLSNGGCGEWVVANVNGDSRIRLGGSGNIWTGSARTLDANIGGSGNIHSTSVEGLKVSIGGSGDVDVQRVNGDVTISIAGSGGVDIDGGRIASMTASIAGSGDVEADAVVTDLSASIVGSGDIKVRRVTGNLSQRVIGSGKVYVDR